MSERGAFGCVRGGRDRRWRIPLRGPRALRTRSDVDVSHHGPTFRAARRADHEGVAAKGFEGKKAMNVTTLLCVAEWAFFILYWDAAAKNSSPAKVSESRQSRRVHQLLLNAGLLLEL